MHKKDFFNYFIKKDYLQPVDELLSRNATTVWSQMSYASGPLLNLISLLPDKPDVVFEFARYI